MNESILIQDRNQDLKINKAIDDLAVILRLFVSAMYAGLITMAINNWDNWNSEKWMKDNWKDTFESCLKKAKVNGYQEEDMIDIANFCMFMYTHRIRQTKDG